MTEACMDVLSRVGTTSFRPRRVPSASMTFISPPTTPCTATGWDMEKRVCFMQLYASAMSEHRSRICSAMGRQCSMGSRDCLYSLIS